MYVRVVHENCHAEQMSKEGEGSGVVHHGAVSNPLELDQLLNDFGVEYLEVLRSVVLQGLEEGLSSRVIAQNRWQQVQGVLYFIVSLLRLRAGGRLCFAHPLFELSEHFAVFVPEIARTVVVWHDDVFLNRVCARPLIELKPERKYVVEDLGEVDAAVEQCHGVVKEQVRVAKVTLVLHDVVDHRLHG